MVSFFKCRGACRLPSAEPGGGGHDAVLSFLLHARRVLACQRSSYGKGDRIAAMHGERTDDLRAEQRRGEA